MHIEIHDMEALWVHFENVPEATLSSDIQLPHQGNMHVCFQSLSLCYLIRAVLGNLENSHKRKSPSRKRVSLLPGLTAVGHCVGTVSLKGT